MHTHDDFLDLIHGVNQAEVIKITGAHRTTYTRWMSGEVLIPYASYQLLRIVLKGDLSAMIGSQWAGWTFGRDGLIYAPTWRRGFAPEEFQALPFLYSSKRTLEFNERQLQQRISDLNDEVYTLTRDCAFYRNQLRLESTMGMALVRIMG